MGRAMFIGRAAACALVALGTFGCAARNGTETTPTNAMETAGTWLRRSFYPPPAGVAYYLPRRAVVLTFDRVDVSKELAAKVGEVEAKRAAAAKAAKDAREELAPIDLEITALVDKGLGPAHAAYQAAAARRAVTVAALPGLEAAAARATLEKEQIEAVRNAALLRVGTCGYADRFGIRALDMEADARHRYVAEFDHNVLRTDHLKLKTDRRGLLSNVSGEFDGQGDEILVSLARAYGAMIGLGVAPSMPGMAMSVERPQVGVSPPDPCKNVEPLHLETLLTARSLSELENGAKGFGTTVTRFLSKKPFPKSYAIALHVPGSVDKNAEDDRRNLCTRERTICYRRELPLHFEVQQLDDAVAVTVSTLSVNVPNFSPTEVIELEANAFTRATNTISFADGILLEADQLVPSEAAAVAEAPFRVARGIVEGATEIVRLRVDYTTQQTGLAEQQTALLEGQAALVEAARKLAAAQQAQTGAPPTADPVAGEH